MAAIEDVNIQSTDDDDAEEVALKTPLRKHFVCCTGNEHNEGSLCISGVAHVSPISMNQLSKEGRQCILEVAYATPISRF